MSQPCPSSAKRGAIASALMPAMQNGTGWIVLCIWIAALAIRLWNVSFGLPGVYHPDEWSKYQVVLRLLEHKKPDYFLHPGLLVNSTAAACWIAERTIGLERDFASITLLGRVLVALAGSLIVFPLYSLGRWLGGGRASGLVSAFLVAFIPIHVVHSRYVKEDIYLCFGIVMCLWGLIEWHEQREGRKTGGWFLLALFGAGVALASKFVGWILLPLCVWIALAGSVRGVSRRGYLAAAVFVPLLVFLVASPQVLDFAKAREDFLWEWGTNVCSSGPSTLPWWRWPDLGTWFFRVAIVPGLTFPLTLCGVFGWIYFFRKSRGRSSLGFWLITACMCLMYAVAEACPTKTGMDRERYALPSAVLLTLFAGAVLGRLLSEARFLLRTGSVLLLIYPAVWSVLITHSLGYDTRKEARDWIRELSPLDPFLVVEQHWIYGDTYSKAWPPHVQRSTFSLHLTEEEIRQYSTPADAIVFNSFYLNRFESLPRTDTRVRRNLELLRREFPHEVRFSRPRFFRHGFHHPVIELRFREPFDRSFSHARPDRMHLVRLSQHEIT